MNLIQSVMGMSLPLVPIHHFWNMDIKIITAIFYLTALCYAAVQDIRTKEVDDSIHIIIAVTAFIGFRFENLPGMLFGAVLSALPLFIAALIKKGCIGGADIKLMAASGLLLGAEKGIIALIIGLFSGVICTYIYRKIKKAELKTSFPLVPFLAAGCVFTYLL